MLASQVLYSGHVSRTAYTDVSTSSCVLPCIDVFRETVGSGQMFDHGSCAAFSAVIGFRGVPDVFG